MVLMNVQIQEESCRQFLALQGRSFSLCFGGEIPATGYKKKALHLLRVLIPQSTLAHSVITFSDCINTLESIYTKRSIHCIDDFDSDFLRSADSWWGSSSHFLFTTAQSVKSFVYVSK